MKKQKVEKQNMKIMKINMKIKMKIMRKINMNMKENEFEYENKNDDETIDQNEIIKSLIMIYMK